MFLYVLGVGNVVVEVDAEWSVFVARSHESLDTCLVDVVADGGLVVHVDVQRSTRGIPMHLNTN